MLPPIDAVPDEETMPRRTEVVVIGGGIAGVSTAFFLAERGVPTVLCEKGRIGAEQSGRNWGWCRVMGRDPREIPLAIESLRLWRDMQGCHGPFFFQSKPFALPPLSRRLGGNAHCFHVGRVKTRRGRLIA